MDSRLYWIWLQQALGYGSGHVNTLLRAFSSPEEVFAAEEKELTACGLPCNVVKRLCDKSMDAARAILHRTVANGDWLLTPADDAYPSLLRGIYAPPTVLYGRGAVPSFSACPAVAVVGTRSLTRYGYDVTSMIAAGLARGGALVINGGAEGGDAVAASAALDVGGKVVTVQACGLDVNYPVVNEPLRRRTLQQGGTLLTEYPYGVKVTKGTFHVRNRLLSGMAHGVCVTEAPYPSGTLITATFAREQGRDVFAVPGAVNAPNSAGGNTLIQHGAKLVRRAEEILEEYRPLFPTLSPPVSHTVTVKEKTRPEKRLSVAAPPMAFPMSETAAAVLKVLGADPLPVDEIAVKADITVSQTLAALTELEMLGSAVAEAGQQYRRG